MPLRAWRGGRSGGKLARMIRIAPALALAMLPALAGCSDDPEPQVATVSPTEAKALDDAAEMLDQRRLPPAAIADDAGHSDTGQNDTKRDTAPARGEAQQ